MNTDNNNLFNFNFDVNNNGLGLSAPDSCLVNNKFSNVQDYIQFINGSLTNQKLIISHTNFPVYDEAVDLEDEVEESATNVVSAHCPCCPVFNEAIKKLNLERLAEIEDGCYHLNKRAKTCDFASATVASSFAYLFAPSAAEASAAEAANATDDDEIDAIIDQTGSLNINIDQDNSENEIDPRWSELNKLKNKNK